MSDKVTIPCKAKLVRGASFVIPGRVFLPGKWESVTDQAQLDLIKRSQQFQIEAGDLIEEKNDQTADEDQAGEVDKKFSRKKRK